jgi:hypothetical protein
MFLLVTPARRATYARLTRTIRRPAVPWYVRPILGLAVRTIRRSLAEPHRTRRLIAFTRTCTRAAKLLLTVRAAVPRYVWPILALAAIVKCIPFDCGTDEALFCLAFALIAWRRPGLLTALYREAAAGKPAPAGPRVTWETCDGVCA